MALIAAAVQTLIKQKRQQLCAALCGLPSTGYIISAHSTPRDSRILDWPQSGSLSMLL